MRNNSPWVKVIKETLWVQLLGDLKSLGLSYYQIAREVGCSNSALSTLVRNPGRCPSFWLGWSILQFHHSHFPDRKKYYRDLIDTVS